MQKKSGACLVLFVIFVIWFVISMIPAQMMAGRMVSAQRSQCAMIKEGLYQFSGNYPQPGQYVPKTEEECLNMVNQASFMPRVIFSVGAIIAAAFLTGITIFVLANLPSRSGNTQEG